VRYIPYLLFALFAHFAGAQAPDTTTRAPGAKVTGVVRDSVARKPLAEALVQLVSADDPGKFVRTSKSDSAGRFAIQDVPIGRYTIGFFHPALDSLGIELALHALYVGSAEQSVKADLGTPSAARLRAEVCGKQGRDSSGVIIGIVRDAQTGSPAAGVTVTGEWLEFMLRRNALVSGSAQRMTTSRPNGWYAMCDVPTGGSVALRASNGIDSTGLIEVEVPSTGIIRRELYISAGPGIETGSGKLNGTVAATAGGRPLGGALVSIVGGPQTRANDAGEWSFANAPTGTRMLEVRALGYYPFRNYVHVLSGAAPVHVSLSTLDAVLDTVRVRSNRLSAVDRTGFADRRHSGPGRYYTSAHVARRQVVATSDFFKTVPGIRLGYASDTLATDMAIAVSPDDMSLADKRLLMRGISGDWCAPAIYLDGIHMPHFGADDLDGWLQPKDVAGIEVYSEATVPNEFQQGRSGCGSVVIWKKPAAGKK
jgi:hypothetical protein